METPISISFKFRIPDYAIITEDEIIFTPIVATNLFKRAQQHLYTNTSLEEREYPFRDRCSRLVELTEVITLPPFDNAVYLTNQEDIDGSAAFFSGKYDVEENRINLTETIKIKKRVFEADEWANYKSVVEAQQNFAEEKIILSR
jgi:hypothetical protein